MDPSRDIRWFLDVGASVVMLVAGLAVIAAVGLNWQSGGTVRAGADPAQPVVDVTNLGLSLTDALSRIENPSAGLVLVEFSDFECPFCAKHANETLPKLRRSHLARGSVGYLFKHLPLDRLHPRARQLANFAACAGRQGKFTAVHDALFSRSELLQRHIAVQARQFGLDHEILTKCLADSPAEIEKDGRDARNFNVNSTPTFFIGRRNAEGALDLVKRINGAVEYETFRAALDEQLKAMAR